MKIIVTGCKGQLGTELLKQLQEGRSELGPIPEKLLNATVIPVDLPELDISNYRMVDEFVRRNRPDIIINCAAYTNVDGCEVHHDDAFKAKWAQLIAVPDDRLLEIYNALRPYRSTKQELLDIAGELDGKYGAKTAASLVREAAEVYEKRGRLKKF